MVGTLTHKLCVNKFHFINQKIFDIIHQGQHKLLNVGVQNLLSNVLTYVCTYIFMCLGTCFLFT